MCFLRSSVSSRLTNLPQLRSERLITCQQSAPKWVRTLLGGDMISHVLEVSYVDPTNKKVTMFSTNLTWSNAISVNETVVYEPHPNEPETKTQFKQEAKITALCGGWQKIKNGIEDATVERFGQNAEMGRQGFETVLEISRRVFGEQREMEQQEQQQQQQQHA